jgi:hypothetical protein
MRTFLPYAALAAVSAALPAQGALSSTCFISQFGTPLGLGDDQVAQGNNLGFTFPGPAGPVTSIDISSNGFVWLAPSTNSACCNGDVQSFLTGLPRIAPLWMDLNPSQSGEVWFNTIPPSGSQPAGAVVTWDQVPEFGEVVPMTVQLQLWADGSFSFFYAANVYNSFHDALSGVTQGGNATANPVDFSTVSSSSPLITGSNPTAHELQLATMDLQGRILVFVPAGTGYIVLDRPTCPLADVASYGVGCPKPASAYELFAWPTTIDLSNLAIEFTPATGGGYVALPSTGFFTGTTNALTFQDDQVQGPFALPFPFSYPGGSTTAIDISSNGFIWLQTGNTNSRCCDGDPFTFLNDPASIAALWMDLYPPGGGNIYFDVVGSEAHVTWSAVPEFFSGPPQTAQITLRANGSFRLAWQTVANTSHDVLVGFTQGSSSVDPGPSDFSAGPVIVGSGGTPLELRSQAGSRPGIGSTYTMEVDQIPAGSLAGLMVLGLTQLVPGVDLTFLGMQGCELHASLDALLSYALTGSPTPFPVPIPNNVALAGFLLHAQAATLTPGVNTLGIATSNGLRITVGY